MLQKGLLLHASSSINNHNNDDNHTTKPTAVPSEPTHFFYNPAKPSGRAGGPPPAGRVTYWFCQAKA